MLMRSLRNLALVGGLFCATGMAQAQMTMQMNTPKFPMLMSKPVQQELKMSEEQIKKIQAKMKELMPEGAMMPGRVELKGDGGKAAGSGGDTPPQVSFGVVIKGSGEGGVAAPPIVLGSPGTTFKVGGDGFAGMPDFKKLDDELDKLLEQPQRDRLKQIVLQRQGMAALAQDSIAKDVGLDGEQKELVKQIMDDQTKKTQEFFQKMIADGGGFSREKIGEFMKKQREQTESDLGIILTPDQKTKWEELLGPKFDGKGK